MSTFQLLPHDKRQELCSLLPQVDQESLLSPVDSFYYDDEPSFFSKVDNSVLWDSISDWQSMLGQGVFMPDSPPVVPFSPPKSTCSSNKPKPRNNVKKEKIKVLITHAPFNFLLNLLFCLCIG
jgi:hypothetical protein